MVELEAATQANEECPNTCHTPSFWRWVPRIGRLEGCSSETSTVRLRDDEELGGPVSVNARIASRWYDLCTVYSGCTLGLIIVTWPTAQSLLHAWASRTFGHGMLVLPATLYMVWCYRDRLRSTFPGPDLSGLVSILAVALLYAIGNLVESLVLRQGALLGMLAALVWGLFGRQVFLALRFPLGFLLFALPVGTAIEPWLQAATANGLSLALAFTGIPVLRDGFVLTLPSGSWEVAADCGGLRYLLPGLALAYLYTAIVHATWKRRLQFLSICGVSLVAANCLRAYGIVLADHVGFAVGTDHRLFSYSVLGGTLLVLAWLGHRWSEEATLCRTAGCSPL